MAKSRDIGAYLTLRGRRYFYMRRVPVEYAELDSRRFVRISLKTDSLAVARARAAIVNSETEAYWQSLMMSQSKDGLERYEAAIKRARTLGVQYMPLDELARSDLSEILSRVARIETPESANRVDTSALLGMEAKPDVTMTRAFDVYCDLMKAELREKSDDQIRKWKNPKLKALRNFVGVVGDKNLADVTPNDGLDFRDYWLERINEDGLTANSANKDIGALAVIIKSVSDHYRLGLDNPFKGLRVSDRIGTERLPFDPDYVQSVLLNSDRLAGLNTECRLLIHVFASTGARPSEILGLAAEDIHLDSDIPYIEIRPNDARSLKTRYSARTIPLCGSALEAMKVLPAGFSHYRGAGDLASNVVNKFLRDNDLKPTEKHTLYSLRHTFQDRLTAVEAPDRIQADLMGHKFNRPTYGKGADLAQKQSWVQKVAFHAP